MIVLDDACDKCGAIPIPTEVACDKCAKTQKMDDFVGIVIHFEHDAEGCEDDCQDCEKFLEEEFHFCNLKCLSDYIADPLCVKLLEYDDQPMSLHCNTADVATIFNALGRGDMLW
jgi:RNA polymerase subunit RPABC4/transcription elongation factor Spt4